MSGLFSDICNLCNNLESAKSPKTKESLLSLQLNLSGKFKFCTDEFYYKLRLIFPSIDLDRSPYGLQEKSLSSIYGSTFNLPESAVNRLVHFNNSRFQSGFSCKVGDFSSVLCSVLENRLVVTKSGVNVSEVNDCLDAVANCTGKSSL
jgi:hypothetical protein